MESTYLFWLTGVTLIVAAFLHAIYRHFTYWDKQGVPSHHYITLGLFLSPFHEFVHKERAKMGRLYGTYGFSNKVLNVTDARIARDLSTKELYKFPIRSISFNTGTTNIYKGLFFMEADADWKRIRSIVSPAFTSGKLKSMISPIEKITSNFIAHLRPRAQSGELFDLKPHIGGITMDVLVKCAFGIEIDSVSEPAHPMVVNVKKILNVDVGLTFMTCITWPQLAKFLKLDIFNREAVDYLDQVTYKILEKRLEQNGEKQNSDLLGLMMNECEAISDPASNGLQNPHKTLKGLSKEEISGQGIIFFIAGFDTTHATFNHVFYHLGTEPEWQEKLYQELAEVDQLKYDQLQTLPLLNAIINETLRLHPALQIIQREAPEECDLLDTGIRVPKAGVIQIYPEVIHRDPEYFPEPNRFNPGRFLDNPQLESHFAYMPFGAGPRLCVGKRFALNELRIGVAQFVLNYKIEVDPDFKPVYFRGSGIKTMKKLMVRISERN